MYLIAEPEPGSKVRLKFFIEQRLVDQAYQQLYQDISSRGNIPGFRKGKVPIWRIRRHFGEHVVDGAVFGELMERALRSLVAHADLRPVQPVDFGDDEEPKRAAAGEPLEAEAFLQVRPETRVVGYEGLQIEVPDTEPTEEQIEEGIRNVRDAAAELIEVTDREVRAGDLVEVTLKTKVEGEEDEQERQEAMIVGESRYDPPLDTHLLGHRIGETVEFTVDYPDRRSMGDLAGKRVAMSATIKAITERRVPELDDELAAKAEASSAEELRQRIVEQVREKNQEFADQVLRNRAAEWLTDNARIDLPASLLETADQAEDESMSSDSEESAGAERIVKLQLACEALLEQQRVEVTEEDVREEYIQEGQRHGLSQEVLSSDDMADNVYTMLYNRLVRRRAIDFIAEAATRKVVPLSELLEEGDGEEAGEKSAEEASAPTEEQENEQTS